MAKKQGKKAEHAFFEDSYEKHDPVGGYDNGACLSPHLSWWKENDSCSYRWQGLKKAEENPGPYNSHGDPDCHLGGGGWGFPAVSRLDAGKAGQILVSTVKEIVKTSISKKGVESSTRKRLVQARNFTNGFAPYGNQVHHILPTATLRNCIDTTTKSNVDQVKNICDGLLKEKYNINFKKNMIILATQWRDACQIGLPVHLGNHPNYSDEIKAKVMRALSPWDEAASQAPDHPAPDFFDLKYELEALEDNMYTSIVDHGKSTIKDTCDDLKITVDDLPPSVFS
jgi:hypothetical protein